MSLTQRKFKRSDIAELFTWFPTEYEALQWAGAELAWPLQSAAITRLVKAHSGPTPDREIWAVCNAGGEMMGHYQLRCNRRLRTVGLGRIAIRPDQRGSGLGHKLTDMALRHAFGQSWVHRVELLVYSHNIPAITTYENAGFVLEGMRRQTTPAGAEIWDTLMMSMLRFEFEKKIDKRTERE